MSRIIVETVDKIAKSLGHLGPVHTTDEAIAEVASLRELNAHWTLAAFRAYREGWGNGIEGWSEVTPEGMGLPSPSRGYSIRGLAHTTASGRLTVVAWPGWSYDHPGAIDLIVSAGSDPLPALWEVSGAGYYEPRCDTYEDIEFDYSCLFRQERPSIDGQWPGDKVWVVDPDAREVVWRDRVGFPDEVREAFVGAGPARVAAVRFIPGEHFWDDEVWHEGRGWKCEVLEGTPHLIVNRPDRVSYLQGYDEEFFGGTLSRKVLWQARKRLEEHERGKKGWFTVEVDSYYPARWLGYAFQELDKRREAAAESED